MQRATRAERWQGLDHRILSMRESSYLVDNEQDMSSTAKPIRRSDPSPNLQERMWKVLNRRRIDDGRGGELESGGSGKTNGGTISGSAANTVISPSAVALLGCFLSTHAPHSENETAPEQQQARWFWNRRIHLAFLRRTGRPTRLENGPFFKSIVLIVGAGGCPEFGVENNVAHIGE